MSDTLQIPGLADGPTADIAAFLEGIGIPVELVDLPGPTFLPGVRIERGKLLVDLARLAYPGDLLHEAGHIAVMTPASRASTCDEATHDLGEEIVAELWSWAALVHLGLPPALVFHQGGYRGASPWFIETFSSGTYPGLPLLQWMGLTLDPEKAAARGVAPFPHMLQWLRTEG